MNVCYGIHESSSYLRNSIPDDQIVNGECKDCREYNDKVRDMESSTDVKPIQVNLYCDNCDKNMLLDKSDYKIYEYKCSVCNKTVRSKIKYPFIKYVPI